MTEHAFVSPGERIAALVRPVVVRLPDAAKVAVLPLLVFWAVGEGSEAVMGWVQRDLLDAHAPTALQRALFAVVSNVPIAIRACLAAMLVIGWLRVLTRLEAAGWFSGLTMSPRVVHGWVLVLVMGAGHLFVEQLLYLLDLVRVGDEAGGFLSVAASLPGMQGLVFDLLGVLAWAPVLPLGTGFVAIARGEPFVPQTIVARLRGRWWRTAGVLVALLALVRVLAWFVTWRLPAILDAPWLWEVLPDMFVLWRIAALMLVATGAAVLEARRPPLPRRVAP